MLHSKMTSSSVLLIIFYFINLALAFNRDHECGIGNIADPSTWESEVEPSMHPWIARIKSCRDMILFSYCPNECTGILISRQYLLTSSKCAPVEGGYFSRKFKIILGSKEISKDSWNEEAVIELGEAPRANFGVNGIIKLKEPLQYSDSLRPVCLPSPVQVHDVDKVLELQWEVRGQGSAKKEILIQKNLANFSSSRKIGHAWLMNIHYDKPNATLIFQEENRWFVAAIGKIFRCESGFESNDINFLVSEGCVRTSDFDTKTFYEQVSPQITRS